MKVNLPIQTKDSIDFGAIDFTQGVIITNNPKGVIQCCAGEYYFYTCADAESQEISDYNANAFIEELLDKYPNIIVEYFENEC